MSRKPRAIFTLPGMVGDNLARLPIAYRYARTYGPVRVALDGYTAPSLLPLLARLSWVERAFMLPGVLRYDCGGQPWDFGYTPEQWAKTAQEVYHLGYGQPGTGGLSLTAWACPTNYPLERDGWFTERPLGLSWHPDTVDQAFPVVCAKSTRPFADQATRDIANRAGITQYASIDDLPLYEAAAAMARAPFVVSTYSATCILASLIGAPCVVVTAGGTGLFHYDMGTEHYPGWQVYRDHVGPGLLAAIESATERAAMNARRRGS